LASKSAIVQSAIDKNGPTGARGVSFGGSWTPLLTPSARSLGGRQNWQNPRQPYSSPLLHLYRLYTSNKELLTFPSFAFGYF
jgi:hypothetical protein